MLNDGINDLIYNLQHNEKIIINFDRWSMLNEGINDLIYNLQNNEKFIMTHLLLLGKFEYTGGPIFKVVLEC